MSSPEVVVKNRWLGFLIWQSIASAAVYLSTSLLLLLRGPSPLAILSFLVFHLSLLLLSLSLFLLSSPHPDPSASLPDLAAVLLRVSLRSLVGGFSHSSSSPDARRRARRALASALFLVICAVSGFLSVVAACGESELLYGLRLVGLGLRGSVFGLVYGLHYVFRKRWILQFPIIQRPLFYSFKMGISSSLKRALKVSTQAFFCSSLLVLFLPDQFKYKGTMGKYIIQQIKFYIGAFSISFCWEISHHLLQASCHFFPFSLPDLCIHLIINLTLYDILVVHTRRCIFVPPQGSAAAETNPSDILLETLEQSNPRSLLQYLAYLDLCMVAESNVEPWRRAAVFEETGETYRRVVNLCLKPLEQLTSRIAEGLETFPVDKSDFLSQQLNSPATIQGDSRLNEAFDDSQMALDCFSMCKTASSRHEWLWQDQSKTCDTIGVSKDGIKFGASPKELGKRSHFNIPLPRTGNNIFLGF
ncbi:hypothetical protein COCNU_scaffold017295G000010 [Cocos nucifera]|nr:hypothetical protein [Cocos nucifera]